MRSLYLLVPILLVFSCSQPTSEFATIPCDPSIAADNPNVRRVFKPCREYIYVAKYWDHEYNLISKERIWMMATGNGWKVQPELQDELIVQYNYDSAKTDFLATYSINPEHVHWNNRIVTGVIEDGSETWMHPFRDNQYAFTEVASFPSVKLPLELGKTWTSTFRIKEGWGVWANSTLNETYEVVDYEVVTVQYKNLEAWHIRGIATAEFGTSVHDFWYNEEYGFIRMFVKNYAGQMLQFDLAEVKEN